MEETIRRKTSALRTMLEMMEVPELRMDLDRAANLRWLGRNLGIQNGNHPMFETARELIVWLVREKDAIARKKQARPVC